MKIKISKLSIFYLAYCSFIIYQVLSRSMYTEVIPYRWIMIFKYASVLFCVAKIALLGKTFKKKEIIVDVIFIFIALLIVAAGYDSRYLITFLLISAAKDIDFDKTIRYGLITLTICLAFVFVGTIMGIIPNLMWIHTGTDKVAYGLGFSYYSFGATYVFSVLCMWLYLRREKYTLLELVMAFLIEYYVYNITTSRLYFYGIILLEVLCVLYKYSIITFQNKVWNIITYALFPFFQILSFAMAILYGRNSQLAYMLNVLFSGRLKYMYYGYANYGMHLLPQYINMNGASNSVLQNEYFYIDSGYMYSALCFGLLCTIVINIMYIFLFKRSWEMKDKFMYIWLIVISIMCLSNNFIISIILNPITLLIPSIVKEWDKNGDYVKQRKISYEQ